MKKRWGVIFQVLISVSLLIFVVYRTGIRDIVESFSDIRIVYIVPVFISGFVIFVLSAINFYRLCSTKCRIPFRQFLKFFYITRVFGEYTPGRVGDFSIIAYMRSHDVPASYTLFFTLVDKGMNILNWIFFLLVSSLFFLDTFKQQFIAFRIPSFGLLAIFLVCICVAVVFLAYGKRITSIFPKVIRFFCQHFRVLAFNFLITLTKSLISFASVYCTFLAFGITPSFFHIIFVQSLFCIANILPITISGIGVREFVYTSIFPLAGIPAGIAVSAALISPIIGGISKIVVLTGYIISPFLRVFTKK